MGNATSGQLTCPPGFEPGTQLTCRSSCPDDFVYSQTPRAQICALKKDTSKSVTLTALPINATPAQTAAENKRVAPLFDAIRKQVTTHQSLTDAQDQSGKWVQKYDSLQSRYADFSAGSAALENTNKVLKPKRLPTAPAEDLSRARELVLNGPTIDILMIQVALFFAVLSLVSFLVLPRDAAQGLTFLLLCTGVAIGFFLRK